MKIANRKGLQYLLRSTTDSFWRRRQGQGLIPLPNQRELTSMNCWTVWSVNSREDLVKDLCHRTPPFFKFLKKYLKPLLLLTAIDLEALDTESKVSKSFLLNKISDSKYFGFTFLSEAMQILLPFKEAFPFTYKVHCTAQTFDVSTVSCERTFSCLTQILAPNRRSMSQEILRNLTLLSCENDMTAKLCKETFLEQFKRKKDDLHYKHVVLVCNSFDRTLLFRLINYLLYWQTNYCLLLGTRLKLQYFLTFE